MGGNTYKYNSIHNFPNIEARHTILIGIDSPEHVNSQQTQGGSLPPGIMLETFGGINPLGGVFNQDAANNTRTYRYDPKDRTCKLFFWDLNFPKKLTWELKDSIIFMNFGIISYGI